MTALSVPVALALALHCAPAIDPALLVGIAQRESGLDPLTLRDDTTGQVLHGAGVADAAKRLVAAGHSVDLGPWQINNRNLGLLGLAMTDAFEPCKAAAAAARLIQPMSRYNTGSPSRGVANGYAPAVLAAIHIVKAAGRTAMPPTTVTRDLQPISVPDPFTRPAPTGPDLVFATARK